GLGKFLYARIRLLDRCIVMLSRLEGGAFAFELRDVGAGDEGLAACAREHYHAHLVILGEALEDPARRRPHIERYGVMTLGIVEDHVADAPVLAREHLGVLGHAVHRLPSALRAPTNFPRQTAFALRNAAISFALNPNSLSTASVCSPSAGGGAASRLGVRDSAIGWAAMRRVDLSLVFTD